MPTSEHYQGLSELSRYGRQIWEVLESIKFCVDNGINVYFQKEGLELFDGDKVNGVMVIYIYYRTSTDTSLKPSSEVIQSAILRKFARYRPQQYNELKRRAACNHIKEQRSI